MYSYIIMKTVVCLLTQTRRNLFFIVLSGIFAIYEEIKNGQDTQNTKQICKCVIAKCNSNM